MSSRGEAGTQQHRLGALLADHLHPLLRELSFRRSAHTWWRRDDQGGWHFLQVQGDRCSTRARASFIVNVVSWPAGTWQVYCDVLGGDSSQRPFVAGNAPLTTRPEPPRAFAPDGWWLLTDEVDLDALGAALRAHARAVALPLLERRASAGRAAAELLERGGAWDCIYAVAALRHSQADAERQRAAVLALTSRWLPDPRPAQLLSHLNGWRATLGLPPVALSP